MKEQSKAPDTKTVKEFHKNADTNAPNGIHHTVGLNAGQAMPGDVLSGYTIAGSALPAGLGAILTALGATVT